MKTIYNIQKISLLALLFSTLLFTNCSNDDDAPMVENEEEVITDVKLIFTNTSDASDIVEANAKDPDGPGVEELAVESPINLTVGKTYTLTFEILNKLNPADIEDIGEEIEEEADEHQIFFGFTDAAFTNPMGDGNIDNPSDPINYNDLDVNSRPIGLSTTWTTGASAQTGKKFKVRLQHQPDGIKSSTSSANDGDTDFELEFDLNIN